MKTIIIVAILLFVFLIIRRYLKSRVFFKSMSSFALTEEKFRNYLIKKLMVHRLLHSETDEEITLRKSLAIQTELDAEQYIEALFDKLTRNQLMQTPEATIAVISEAYRKEVQNNNKTNEEALLIMDKQRFSRICNKLVAKNKELNLENYIIETIKKVDSNNVLQGLYKNVLIEQIQLAIAFMNDYKSRQEAFGLGV